MLTTLGNRVVIGLAIAAALGLADVVGIFAPPPDIGEAPPFLATVVAAALGVITLGAVALAASAAAPGGSRLAGRIVLWVVVATRVVSVLVAVPTALLIGMRTPLVVWSVVTVAATVVAVVLVITGAVRDPAVR